MRREGLMLLLLFIPGIFVWGQQQEESEQLNEQQVENLQEKEGDDSDWQLKEYLRKHPLDINTVSEEALRSAGLLTEWQLIAFFRYRKLMGVLIDIHELQAIPGWDPATIRSILPYIIVGQSAKNGIPGKWIGAGNSELLLRWGRSFSSKKLQGYTGSADRLLFRYKYQYDSRLQTGFTAEKDEGEPVFKRNGPRGFDFYSAHLFVQPGGIVKSMAVGDYSIRLGQGLVQWQGMAFSKTADVLAIKKQDIALKPYNAAGEFNFHRGMGLTLKHKKWESVFFLSARRLSASRVTDSLKGTSIFSSIQETGYHRTESERENRKQLGMLTKGASLRYHGPAARIGINAIHYNLSDTLSTDNKPYNYFTFRGKRLFNFSVDYSYTFRNVHFFGEIAASYPLTPALINGAVISLDPKVSLAVLHRSISPSFHSFFSGAFTDNSSPVNENGWYAGLSLRPSSAWTIDMFADIFNHPWLSFASMAPQAGYEYFLQIKYVPARKTEFYGRLRVKAEEMVKGNERGTEKRTSIRLHFNHPLNRGWLYRMRVEMVTYKGWETNTSHGFTALMDWICHPAGIPVKAHFRVQYFDTDDYSSRVYVFENDLPSVYNTPAFHQKGFRWYLNASIRLKKLTVIKIKDNLTISVKFAQTIDQNRVVSINSDDSEQEKSKSELKIQLLMGF